MGEIDGIGGVTQGGSAPSVGLGLREQGAAWIGRPEQSGATAPPRPVGDPEQADLLPEAGSAGTVRSGHFGGDGRFEKLILALQALRLDQGAASSRTDRVERMQAAAEELFGIDGNPQPVRPAAGNEAAPFAAAEAERTEPAPAAAVPPAAQQPGATLAAAAAPAARAAPDADAAEGGSVG